MFGWHSIKTTKARIPTWTNRVSTLDQLSRIFIISLVVSWNYWTSKHLSLSFSLKMVYLNWWHVLQSCIVITSRCRSSAFSTRTPFLSSTTCLSLVVIFKLLAQIVSECLKTYHYKSWECLSVCWSVICMKRFVGDAANRLTVNKADKCMPVLLCYNIFYKDKLLFSTWCADVCGWNRSSSLRADVLTNFVTEVERLETMESPAEWRESSEALLDPLRK